MEEMFASAELGSAETLIVGKGLQVQGNCDSAFDRIGVGTLKTLVFRGTVDFQKISNAHSFLYETGMDSLEKADISGFKKGNDGEAVNAGYALQDFGTANTTYYVPNDWLDWAPDFFNEYNRNSYAIQKGANLVYGRMPGY